jgi:hypothetical protein
MLAVRMPSLTAKGCSDGNDYDASVFVVQVKLCSGSLSVANTFSAKPDALNVFYASTAFPS